MMRWSRALTLLILLPLLGLAACGQSTTGPNEVSMGASDFSRSSVTITARQTVHFTDPAGTGGTHIICLGADGGCEPGATEPQALRAPGFTINPGDPAHDVLFETPGAYKVTCTIHPAMNLIVIV